jgi:hypothetical protein
MFVLSQNNIASARNILELMKIFDEFMKFGKACNFNIDFVRS